MWFLRRRQSQKDVPPTRQMKSGSTQGDSRRSLDSIRSKYGPSLPFCHKNNQTKWHRKKETLGKSLSSFILRRWRDYSLRSTNFFLWGHSSWRTTTLRGLPQDGSDWVGGRVPPDDQWGKDGVGLSCNVCRISELQPSNSPLSLSGFVLPFRLPPVTSPLTLHTGQGISSLEDEKG